MKYIKYLSITLLLLICLNQTRAQGVEKISYTPKFDGTIKAKVEMSLYDYAYRFNVRNTRFGISGNASQNMTYRMQVDFSNEGKVSVLDAFVSYKIGGLELKLGQQQIRFSSDLDRGPNTNMFVNRSFLSKYLTSYSASELVGDRKVDFVGSIGSRDLGFMATYQFKKPVKLFLGVFNGDGINNPKWGKTANLITRIEVGRPDKGIRIAGSFFSGNTPTHSIVENINGTLVQKSVMQSVKMVGTEIRYTGTKFFIEGEYARRYLEQENGDDTVLSAAHIHSYYKFSLRETSQISYIAPIVRWDMGDNIDYLNTSTKLTQALSINRITTGVNFGFGYKMIRPEIRLNYEKYLLSSRPSDLGVNPLFQDKITLEVVATF